MGVLVWHGQVPPVCSVITSLRAGLQKDALYSRRNTLVKVA